MGEELKRLSHDQVMPWPACALAGYGIIYIIAHQCLTPAQRRASVHHGYRRTDDAAAVGDGVVGAGRSELTGNWRERN